MNRRASFQGILPPLLFAAALTGVAYAEIGATVGLYFAGIVVATLLTPPLVLAEPTTRSQLLCAAVIVNGVGAVWLFSLSSPLVGLYDWFRGCVLLASYTLFLWGLATVLRRIGLNVVLAAAAVVTLSLAWLAWPVWMSPWIAGCARLVGALSASHPLLALDGVFRALGPPWSERYFMYNYLSVLNQDVPYELPRSILPAVLLHGTIGTAALLLGRWRMARLQDKLAQGDRHAGEKDGGKIPHA